MDRNGPKLTEMDATIHKDNAGDNAALVCTARIGSEVLGYVAIDSTVAGRSCGGLRMMPDVDESEIRGLARAMTLKYGFLGLAQGGAKAGVLGDPEAPRPARLARLARFARAIAPLLRTMSFRPCADMGTNADDIRAMLSTVGVPVGRRQLRANASGYYTALSVLAGAKQSARHVGMELSQCTAAVEGFGKVGAPLAVLLARAGVRVVAVSTSHGAIYNADGLDVERLAQLVKQKGSSAVETYRDAQAMPREALLETPVDLLCPCARHGSVNESNAERISARVICPGANNPVTPQAEQSLAGRGVLCMPDFATNCGGVLGGTMEFAGVDNAAITAFIDLHIAAAIGGVLDEARRRSVAPRAVAEEIAMRRFRRVQLAAENPSLRGRMFVAAMGLYRRGLVPVAAVRSLAPAYFLRCLAIGGKTADG